MAGHVSDWLAETSRTDVTIENASAQDIRMVVPGLVSHLGKDFRETQAQISRDLAQTGYYGGHRSGRRRVDDCVR